MLPKRQRDVLLWTCGHCTSSICGLRLVLGDSTAAEVVEFLKYSKISLWLNPSLAEPLRHWRGSPMEVPAVLASAETQFWLCGEEGARRSGC